MFPFTSVIAAPPETPAFSQDIEISFKPNATGAMVWMVNNQSCQAIYESVKFLNQSNESPN